MDLVVVPCDHGSPMQPGSPPRHLFVYGTMLAGEPDHHLLAAATLVGPETGAASWRQFTWAYNAEPGTHRLASRARDRAGNVQPEERFENHRGYRNNCWRDMSFDVEVQA